LHKATLRKHRREDLITKLAPVDYVPQAQCPEWEKFLDRIMAGNRALIAFLQRAVGYALTGDTREQVLFVLYGTGANGKTTFLETVRAMLGDYAMHTNFSAFLQSEHSTARNDLARLAGARFVSASEVQGGRRLSEDVIKQITGGDTVTARYLYHEFFEYRPQCKLFLAVNHRPVIRGTEHAIWRRVHLIPFTVTIPNEEQDKTLGEKLRAELPGILNWATQGCRDWQKPVWNPLRKCERRHNNTGKRWTCWADSSKRVARKSLPQSLLPKSFTMPILGIAKRMANNRPNKSSLAGAWENEASSTIRNAKGV
jgi:putative DNA primase/helicase